MQNKALFYSDLRKNIKVLFFVLLKRWLFYESESSAFYKYIPITVKFSRYVGLDVEKL